MTKAERAPFLGTPPPLPENALVDLHLHSLHSDGTLSPVEIVRLAKSSGIHAISLTDHDTVAGIEEARIESRAAGIRFLPGIELSIGYQATEIHLLGYGIDSRDRTLIESLDRLAAERYERMEKMTARLCSLGIPAEFEEVRSLAGGKILSRLHLATYLLEKGYVSTREQAFDRLIGNGRPAYVRRRHLSIKDAIRLIVSSKGVPVLAHPAMTKRDDLIDYLVRIGLRGLEVFYPKHSPGDVARYLKVCKKYDLIATGGSDFHGSGKPDTRLGDSSTPPDQFKKLCSYINI